MSVSYEKKQAVVRFEIGKARLEQILKPYVGSPYDVTAAGPVASIVPGDRVSVRAWAEPAQVIAVPAGSRETQDPATIYVEFVPSDESQFTAKPSVEFPPNLLDLGLKPVGTATEVNAVEAQPPIAPGASRFNLSLRAAGPMASPSVLVPILFRYSVVDGDSQRHGGEGKVTVPLDIITSPAESSATPTATGVALVGGALELGLGHLCDQTGCVTHLHTALGLVPGLVGVRPIPSLGEPRAMLFLQAGRAIDIWSLRETLRDQGIEIRRLVPRDLGRFELQIDLGRWHASDDPSNARTCEQCRDQVLAALQALAWTSEASVSSAGVTARTRDLNADASIPLDRLEQAGLAPLSVWLVPQGVATPEPAASRPTTATTGPKTLGSEAHPLIQFDLAHDAIHCHDFMYALANQAWASRTAVTAENLGVIGAGRILSGAAAVTAVGDRQRADLVPLLRDWRSLGRRPTRMRLTEFGDLRVQLEFAHVCGEVEYSKPPEKDKKADEPKPADDDKQQKEKDAAEADNVASAQSTEEAAGERGSDKGQTADEAKKDQAGEAAGKPEKKPFVPKPLRPAESSNARQAIERAIASVKWVQEGTYHEYHTKPQFDGPRTVTITLRPAGDGVAQLDELTRALARAGFPPTAVRVSRLFPGIPFGHAVPPDLELETTGGVRRLVSSYRQAGRPLAIAFVSLYCPQWDKYEYEADPKLFGRFKQLIEAYRDRVDFIAISSNPDDKLAEVAQCFNGVGIGIPLLNDPAEAARAVFNAQITPPPHMFVFDADGRLRFAGDVHSNWNKPDEEQKDFLSPALDAILAGTFAANGAVSFNSPKCNCSSASCKCPKCGCGPSCRCDIGH